MRRYVIALALATASFCCITASAQTAKPLRQLVYNFDVFISTTRTVHSSGIGEVSSSGLTDYSAASEDKGEIDVNVLQVQPDNGLVVQVTEKAHGNRSTKSSMCVTYGNGVVLCDQTSGGVNEESIALLRVLGRDFLSGAVPDEHNHWTYANKAGDSNDVADFTINKDTNGLVNISYVRDLKVGGAQPFTAASDGRLTYNRGKTLPVAITEHTITRREVGMGQDDRTDLRTTISLASDSMQNVVVPNP